MTPPAGQRAPVSASPLDRARRKAYLRLLPILFVSYVIAFVDRTNVAIAKLTMTRELPGFDNAVIGFGAGIFFLGYFLLEIPGTLIVEKWSARLWISRSWIAWGDGRRSPPRFGRRSTSTWCASSSGWRRPVSSPG
jgi:ACS family tartrate transporter-like MFS transporter